MISLLLIGPILLLFVVLLLSFIAFPFILLYRLIFDRDNLKKSREQLDKEKAYKLLNKYNKNKYNKIY